MRARRSPSNRRSRASASGSPKRTLYSISFGPSGPTIRPAKSTPWNGVPRSAMPRTVGSMMRVMIAASRAGVISGAGDTAPMPPVLGPVSPSPTRLWSCAEPNGFARSPSQSAKKDSSSPSRNSSITTQAPAAPKRPAKISVIGRLGFGRRRRDDDALAGRQPIRLDHDGEQSAEGMGPRGFRIGEHRIVGRGNAEVAAEILGEALRPFELGSGSTRARTPSSPAARARSAKPSTSGASGPTTMRSMA